MRTCIVHSIEKYCVLMRLVRLVPWGNQDPKFSTRKFETGENARQSERKKTRGI